MKGLRAAAVAAAWLAGMWVSRRAEFGLVYIICSGMVGVYLGLDHSGEGRKKGYSAYSVFNKDGYRLPGTMDAAQLEQNMRGGGGMAAAAAGMRGRGRAEEFRTNEGLERAGDHPKRMSKQANARCPCGSGKKYKKCCSLLTKVGGVPPDGDSDDGW